MHIHKNAQRGSLLIVTMLLAAVIALVLTSYIRMSITAVKLSQRATFANQGMNLTESGLEQAMLAINKNTWASPWTTSGNDAHASFSGFSFGSGVTGSVKVYIQDYATSNPIVVAKSTVSIPNSGDIIKMVEISGLIQRSLFSKGLVGKNGVTFSGNNPSVDSWNSHYNDDGTVRSSPVGYSAAVAHDKGSIAAVNITASDTVQNADIWGTASVGGASTNLISVGPQGLVGPYGTSSGTKNPNNVSANFTYNFKQITNPSYSVINTIAKIDSQTTLPGGTDHPASDGKYYYSLPSVDLSGNSSNWLKISAGSTVVLIPTAASGTAVGIGGQASIKVEAGAHLDIYTPANVSIAGNGLVNSNATSSSDSVQIWGTNTSSSSPGQTISISGNGSLACTCYAPNAALDVTGGGNGGAVYGSFVAYTVKLTGNETFHYDENLANAANGGSYSPTKWRELVTVADRNSYSTQFSF